MTWSLGLRSVRLRITVAATATVAVGFLILGFVLLSVLRSSLLESQAGSGPRRAAELAALASKAPLPTTLPAIDADPPTFVQLLDPAGAVIGASQPLTGAPALLDPSARGRQVLHDVPGLAEGSWLAEPTPATIGGRSLTLIVLTSLGGYDRGVRLLRNVLLVTVPVLIAFVGVLVWTVIGRTLRTVEAMRLQVDRITSERLDRRVDQPPGADEIGRLARTLNHMLDRLQASSDGQRRFIADASHELRTPIANIRTACEVAGAHPERADWPAVADDVLEQTARMERLTGELLDLARAENARRQTADGDRDGDRGRVDLGELIDEQRGRPVPGDRRLTLSPRRSAVEVQGDRDQLRRVLSNLIDNALRHASREATVTVARGGSWAELRVADDGPGIPAEDRELVFEPFVRLDAHRTTGDGGAGLGLAIVRDVVRAHGGSVEIQANDPGTVVIVRLPLAPS